VRAVARGGAPGGTYHAVAAGETSWHGYACEVLDWARTHGLLVRVPRDGVIAVRSNAYPTAAMRPHNSRLNTQKLKQTFGLTMPHWRSGVIRMLAEAYGFLGR